MTISAALKRATGVTNAPYVNAGRRISRPITAQMKRMPRRTYEMELKTQ